MISREQAQEVARVDALEHGLGRVVSTVLRRHEVFGRGPMVYDVDLDGCWIAYIEQSGSPAIRSSTIVVISDSDGSVLYRGWACDEG